MRMGSASGSTVSHVDTSQSTFIELCQNVNTNHFHKVGIMVPLNGPHVNLVSTHTLMQITKLLMSQYDRLSDAVSK